MIRSNQRFFNLFHVVSDGVLVFFSFVLAHVIRFTFFEGTSNLSNDYYFNFALLASVSQIVIYGIFRLYTSQRKERLHRLLFRLVYCHGLLYMFLLMGLYLVKEVHFSRLTLVFFFLCETLLLFGKRFLLLHTLYYLRKRGYNQKHIVLVGSGFLADKYLEEIRLSPHLGYKLDGYLANADRNLPFDYLGDYTQLEDILTYLKPDEVVVAMSAQDYHSVKSVIDTCELTGTKMSMIPFYTEYFPNPQVDYLHEIPMLHLRPIPLEHFGWAMVKNIVDFVGALILIILLSPVLIGTAIGVVCSSKGPILFTQTRVGKNKKEFKMYKFRSMVVNDQSATTWSTQQDPRKTKFGKFIRKCSIDELPQLFNVLKGEMSLVGPRPEIPHFVEQFKVEIPRYMVKHHIRPGITGWAQINGFRGDTSIEGRIEHDIYYIEHWSLWLDIKILLLTLFKGVFNDEK